MGFSLDVGVGSLGTSGGQTGDPIVGDSDRALLKFVGSGFRDDGEWRLVSPMELLWECLVGRNFTESREKN